MIDKTNQEYDFILVGAGCAGLSLLYRILKESLLNKKRILVIEPSPKNRNDRTWCFWEKSPGMFESIVHHRWNELIFKTESFTNQFELKEYCYKMIQSDAFYRYVLEYAASFNNVEFLSEKASLIVPKGKKIVVQTDTNTHIGDYVFNSSTLFLPEMDSRNTLLQHFKGWVIKTEEDVFDDNIGTLMDFSVSQKHGDTFMYVLPTSKREALIEYTLFTEKTIEQNEYEDALSQYIQSNLGINQYELVHEEYGIIPMTSKKFSRSHPSSNRIIHLGTAGGNTKASSGYTFQFIQKYTNDIVKNLLANKSPYVPESFRDKMFSWYDRTLLEVMISKKLSGKSIFSRLFNKNNPEQLLVFLGNESTIWQEIKIMWTTPIGIFLPSAIRRLLK